MTICPNCNSQNEVGATFCDQCGTSLASVNQTAPPAPAPQPSAGGSSCPSCGTQTMQGEMFCDNCGAQLGGMQQQPTIAPEPPVIAPPPLLEQPTPAPVVAPAPQTVAPPVAPVATSAQVMTSDGQSIMLSGKEIYLLGREDPVSGIFPDIDTSKSGGEEAGVSRRHAEIIQQGNQWFLQDLNSTNGTFMNNQRVAPNARQPLVSGAQIRLGKWIGTFQI